MTLFEQSASGEPGVSELKGRSAALLAVLIFVADQVTKGMILESFDGDGVGESRVLIPGLFSLTYLRNRGGAFGFLADLPGVWGQVFFVVFALATVALLVWMLRKAPVEDFVQRVALTSVIGGAAGNLYDRLRYGEVIDFLDVYYRGWHWPAFNVADSAISVGVALLVVSAMWPRAVSEAGE